MNDESEQGPPPQQQQQPQPQQLDQQQAPLMQQNQEAPQESQSERPPERERDDVCRDFLKNICNRGSRCKFYHPPDARSTSSGDDDYNFCIDYQNRGCERKNCRFVHAPRDEVDRYKETRELTLILARAIAAVSTGDTIGGIPICKEFQNNRCARGVSRCRYWHVNVDLERDRRRRGLPPTTDFPRAGFAGDMGYNSAMGGGANGGGGYGGGMANGGGNLRRRPAPDEYDMDMKRPKIAYDRVFELEKRNAELQKDVDALKRELQREQERYRDLYMLFKQQTSGMPTTKSAAPPEYYANWATPANATTGVAKW
ncbi:unnamed protein product [Caenorhabditis bovis]|uniref:C3H1-type domain-containing protein n=1 Tax=Caenorhabditis bovis TaxID=2654633 RepID=A0A8S1ERD2_9PELO|nr:unnamed protein product [Caenorhabditis bovis]